MTSSEWVTYKDPYPMIRHLLSGDEREGYCEWRPSERKLRLFVCAVARLLERTRHNDERMSVIEACEKIADGLPSTFGTGEMALGAARRHIDAVWGWIWLATANLNATHFVSTFQQFRGNAGSFYRQKEVADLVREIFGDPFNPIRVPMVERGNATDGYYTECPWVTSDILGLLTAAYQERNDHTGRLRQDNLAILADALDEQIGRDHPIPAHLRSPGPHYRGCWALDLLIIKEGEKPMPPVWGRP